MHLKFSSVNCLVLAYFLCPGVRTRADQEPRLVDPGPPPADAIVLFDGSDLSKWQAENGRLAGWDVKDGVATVNKTGSIMTRQPFGDCQLHIEWATPAVVSGEGQGRGNSGVIFQQRYELQVLDSYQNKTYFNGQAGALYSQYAPLVNVSRKPGEWQSYDVIFHAPRFDEKGQLLKPGTLTVLQNGVLVQDHVEIQGPTAQQPAKYSPHPSNCLWSCKTTATPFAIATFGLENYEFSDSSGHLTSFATLQRTTVDTCSAQVKIGNNF